jgi:DNA-binding transcriptional ArsR family regulator
VENEFKQIASLIGDPTRATILWTLLDGRAFTATEPAIAADTSLQNISMHLAKLSRADLLRVDRQGRHRYYKFSRKDIAYAIEALANLVSPAIQTSKIEKEDNSTIKYCRTCYDHLAGKVGVMITDSLLKQKLIMEKTSTFDISVKGEKWFSDFGIDLKDLKKQKRTFIRPCLDWSERTYHLAGSIGASLLDIMLDSGWFRRTKNSRALIITSKGQSKLYDHFNITV